MLKNMVIMSIVCALSSVSVIAATPSPDGASVYIISPANGAVVSNPVTVVFGLVGMGVAPAGVDNKNTGHHHLLIDTDTPSMGNVIGKDDKHRHFGGGQTQTTIELSPGKHSLQLMLADKGHVPHNPPVVSEKITITVK